MLSRTPRHRPGLQPICDSKRYTPFILLRAARRPVRYLTAHLSAQDPKARKAKCASEKPKVSFHTTEESDFTLTLEVS